VRVCVSRSRRLLGRYRERFMQMSGRTCPRDKHDQRGLCGLWIPYRRPGVSTLVSRRGSRRWNLTFRAIFFVSFLVSPGITTSYACSRRRNIRYGNVNAADNVSKRYGRVRLSRRYFTPIIENTPSVPIPWFSARNFIVHSVCTPVFLYGFCMVLYFWTRSRLTYFNLRFCEYF